MKRRVISLLAVWALLVSACSDDSQPVAPTTAAGGTSATGGSTSTETTGGAGGSGGGGGSAESCGDGICGHGEDCSDCQVDCGECCEGGLCVFPGAEGFGVTTEAGRGGQILRVTNLDDSGEGSLRAAVTTAGPRTIIFDVGGIIDLDSHIEIEEPFVTIAGQTAPSPGITLRGAGIVVQAHDVLIQHLRARPGDVTSVEAENHDALQVLGTESYDVVIDHVSASWAIDEVMSTWYALHDVTFSNCIIAEGLANSIHPKGEHSKGLLIGDESYDVAILRNLFAHNTERNPRLKDLTSTVVVNNLVYDPQAVAIVFSDGVGAITTSVMGNVEIDGADTTATRMLNVGDLSSASQAYVADNVGDQLPDTSGDAVVATPPITFAPLTVLSSSAVQAHVLAHAGARPLDRDEADERIVADVIAGTGSIIDSQSEVGGWGDVPQVDRVLTLPDDPHGDADDDGYTNLEEWLHELAVEVGG